MTFLDRIKETSTSTGTGTFTLGGAVLGYKVFSNGTYKYCIVNDTESEWEVGEGTVASGVLTRTTIEASSNGGAIVSFSAGTKQVFNTVSATYVNSLVPYTGATASVNLGEYGLTAGQLTLDTSPTGTAVVGTTRWNDTIGSSETLLKGGNVLLKDGVDLVARVVNKVTPATTLTKAAYKAVRVSGAQGQRLAVAYAQANNDNNSADTLGLVCETIAQNQEGFIITVGQLLDVNTTGSLQGETWADGDVLYLSPTTAGNITNIKPNGSTGHIVVIGYVEYAHANHGKIYVKVMNGWELDELHNVYISSVANNDVLVYESSTTLWKNKSIATILGYTPANDSLVMKLAGSQTATGYKTFSIGLQTTTGDNYLNYTSDNTHIGYSAAPSAPLKLNVKSSIRVEYTANRYVDIKVNPSLSDYAYIQASNTTGFSIVSSGTLFLRPNDASNTIYMGSYIRQQDITASSLYGSTSLTGRGFEIGTNVPMVFKTTIDTGGGVVGGFIFHGSDNANFAHRVTASTTSLHTIKTTGQLQLHNYTSTSVFTGTVAGLLGFDSSGNVITTSASGGGISGSGTAGQVTYWTGTSAVGGSSNLFWDNTNGRLGIGTSAPANNLEVLGTIYTTSTITSYSADATIRIGTSGSSPAGGIIDSIGFSKNIILATNGVRKAVLYNTGNLVIQNGGTYTDSGYRLDVNGTGASTGALRVTGGDVVFSSGSASPTLTIAASVSSTVFLGNASGSSTVAFELQNASTRRFRILSTSISTTFESSNQTSGFIFNKKLFLPASTTSLSSLNIPNGTAPTTPADGDIWQDGTNIYIRIGGITKTFTIV